MSKETDKITTGITGQAENQPSESESKRRWVTTLISAALLVIMVVLMISSMRLTSPTTDEVTEIGAGYDVLQSGDFSAAGNHPYLLQAFAALPLLTMSGIQLPEYRRPYFPPGSFTEIDYWSHGTRLLTANSDIADQMVFRARLAIVLLAVILGIYISLWSRSLYGALAALLALFLYVFSPNVLANATVATLDLGFTVLTFITFFYFWRLITRPHPKEIIFSGIALGFTLTTKANAPIILVPMLLLIFITPRKDVPHWLWSEKLSSRRWVQNALSFIVSFVAVAFIAWFVVNLVYGFVGAFQPLSHYFPSLTGGGSLNIIAGKIPMPFPEQFATAVTLQISHAASGHPAFLFGRTNPNGWWFYHAFTFLFKVSLPMMLLILGAVIFSFIKRKERPMVSTAEYFLLIPIVSIFVIISLFSIRVGFRHILPIMPFFFVYTSKLGLLFDRRHRPVMIGVGLLCTWYLIISLLIYPNYISYFNVLAGGPENGWRYLVDSNIDWGQDLKGLKLYMDDNDIEKIKLSYFGSADPAFYGIDYTYLPSVGLRPSEPDGKWWYEEGYEEICGPTDGVIAISVTNLQGAGLRNKQCFDWLREREPDAKIGYSIFIYDIEEAVP